MAKTYDGVNMGYWLSNRLDRETVEVLSRIERECQDFYDNRFAIAYLISLDCVIADLDNERLTITDKGRDALEFFGGEK